MSLAESLVVMVVALLVLSPKQIARIITQFNKCLARCRRLLAELAKES